MKQLMAQLLPIRLRGLLLKLAPELRIGVQAIDDNTLRVIREVSCEKRSFKCTSDCFDLTDKSEKSRARKERSS